MAVFLICSEKDNPDLYAKIGEKFPDDNHFVLRQGSQWLIDSQKTTKQVAKELEIGEGDNPVGAVVFLASNWWGYSRASLWEWMESE